MIDLETAVSLGEDTEVVHRVWFAINGPTTVLVMHERFGALECAEIEDTELGHRELEGRDLEIVAERFGYLITGNKNDD